MERLRTDPAIAMHAPRLIVAYALLSLTDYALTMIAFVLGAEEANPALAWFAANGCFEFAKLSLTLLVCCIAFRLWSIRLVRRVIVVANLLMAGIVAYHFYHLAYLMAIS